MRAGSVRKIARSSLFAAALLSVSAYLYFTMAPRAYQAEALVTVDLQTHRKVYDSRYYLLSKDTGTLSTAYWIPLPSEAILSKSVLQSVLRELQATSNQTADRFDSGTTFQEAEKFVKLMASLSVTADSHNPSLMLIRAVQPDPTSSARIANLVASSYVAHSTLLAATFLPGGQSPAAIQSWAAIPLVPVSLHAAGFAFTLFLLSFLTLSGYILLSIRLRHK